MQCAALMLRRGDDIEHVAVATDVPVAMLELFAAEVADDVAAPDQQGRDAQRGVTWGRLFIGTLILIEIAAVANIIACVTALVRPDTGLASLSAVLAVALTLAVYAVARLHSARSR
jgi:hypothetical protein